VLFWCLVFKDPFLLSLIRCLMADVSAKANVSLEFSKARFFLCWVPSFDCFRLWFGKWGYALLPVSILNSLFFVPWRALVLDDAELDLKRYWTFDVVLVYSFNLQVLHRHRPRCMYFIRCRLWLIWSASNQGQNTSQRINGGLAKAFVLPRPVNISLIGSSTTSSEAIQVKECADWTVVALVCVRGLCVTTTVSLG